MKLENTERSNPFKTTSISSASKLINILVMKNAKCLNLGLYRIFRKMGVHREEMTPDASINWDLYFDNFDMQIFIFLLESRFNIEVNDKDINKLTTIKHTLEYLQEKTAVA